jgi:hypothetical protein
MPPDGLHMDLDGSGLLFDGALPVKLWRAS